MAEGNGGALGWFDSLVDDIRDWHTTIIESSGGGAGEHTARLLGACGRAFQGFGDEQFYPTDFDKAAALFHGIICDHAFVDGNKRTASLTVLLFLAARDVIQVAPNTLTVRMLGELAVETAAPPHIEVPVIARWLRRILLEDCCK